MLNKLRVYSTNLILFTLVIVGCENCRGIKKVESEVILNKRKTVEVIDTSKRIVQYAINNNADTATQRWYKESPQFGPITITRNAFNKEVNFTIKPDHEGGEAWNTVWQETVKNEKFERTNRICQLSQSVLLYRKFPEEVKDNYYYVDQPEKLEFLDNSQKTIKTVDIWKNRPYQKLDKQITYHHHDTESAKVLPYDKQVEKPVPTEYSLFTYVRSEGNYVIVNYELRSLEVMKKFGSDYIFINIVGIKHTIHIYDLKGNLLQKLEDVPSVDDAVISMNGEYMMYTSGGIRLASANSPFATIERSGWALMRLKDRKVVYQEFTDDGKLSFGRIWIEQKLLRIAYSTPSTIIDYDYWVFFDENSNHIYTHQLTKDQRNIMSTDHNRSPENFQYLNYKEKFKFRQLQIK